MEVQYRQDIDGQRHELKRLRERYVQRCVNRNDRLGDQAVIELLEDGSAAQDKLVVGMLDGSDSASEHKLQALLAKCLLDLSTTLPIDTLALHKKMLRQPWAAEYQQQLRGAGWSGPAKVVARMGAGQLVRLDPFEVNTQRRLIILELRDRTRLASMAGIKDPLADRPPPSAMPPPHQMPPPLEPAPPQQAGPPPGPQPQPPLLLPPVHSAAMPPPMGAPLDPNFLPSLAPFMPALLGASMGIGPPPVPIHIAGPAMPPPLGPHPHPLLPMPDPFPPGRMPPLPPHAPHDPSPGDKRRPDGPPGGPDLSSLLQHQSVRDRSRVRQGETITELLAKPTARESAQLSQFRTADGASAIRAICQHLTKADCRKARNSPLACDCLHYRRLIYAHTDPSLGNCSFLDTCRNQRTCKHVHYELDPAPDTFHPAGPSTPPGVPQPPVPKYLQALPEPQYLKCDIRKLDMAVLGKFGVIMADPPWEIHQDLPYGTMKDDEMRRMNIGVLQDSGVIFLWVTGRAMELGRECLQLWGYQRVDELIWVKTNQLQRLIRTGRTGHWLNHSKEHCLVGIKGTPALNRYVDCDVVVAEVRETSRKPDEMYSLLERLSPGTRKLEIFARPHNLRAGWVSLGNQLPGVCVKDPDMLARYEARYGPPPKDGTVPT